MNEYEVLIETINPCGGEAHSKKEFKDIASESPEAYVRAEGRWPILDSGKNASIRKARLWRSVRLRRPFWLTARRAS